jgi:hypothetical protein
MFEEELLPQELDQFYLEESLLQLKEKVEQQF